MKKNFKFIILATILCFAFVLSGCNLFQQNYADYLNQTVLIIKFKDAEAGDQVLEISREEYLIAYNNYGSQLSSNYSEEQIKQNTIKALINRKAMLHEAEKESENNSNLKVETGSEAQKYLLYQTYSSLLKNALEYENEYRELINETNDFSEEKVNDSLEYTPYQQKAEIIEQNGQFVIKINNEDSKKIYSKDFASGKEAEEKMFEAIYSDFCTATKDNKQNTIKQVSYGYYLKSLRDKQELVKTNYSDKQLFINEIKRIYNNLKDNYILTEYQKTYTNDDGISTISVKQVFDRYKAMVESDYSKYNTGADYDKDIVSTSEISNIDYYMNQDYFFVSHILVKFEDENALKDIDNNEAWDIDTKNTKKDDLYNKLMATDQKTGAKVPVASLLSQINSELQGKSDSQKVAIFKNYLYQYNEDPGIRNAEYPYVVGVNNSQMVQSFTDASRELNKNGEFGAISGLVRSEYGVHIIFYCGKTNNAFDLSQSKKLNLEINNENITKLQTTLLNPFNNKTLFDKIYESLESDDYSLYETLKLADITSPDVLEYTIVANI